MTSWIQWVWNEFIALGPVANVVAIITPVIGVSVWFLRKTRHKSTQIANLKDDLAHRQRKLEDANVKIEKLEKRAFSLGERLASTTLEKAEREWRDGNDQKAQNELERWLELEGELIAKVFFYRAEWAAARAVGDLRASAYVVAAGFARAALICAPANKNTIAFLQDIRAIREAEAQQAPAFHDAFAQLCESDSAVQFNPDAVINALAAQHEVEMLVNRGLYHLAMPLSQRVVGILRGQLGPNARQTLDASTFKVFLMQALGHGELALKEVEQIISAAKKWIGPDDELTHAALFMQAQVLDGLGRSSEALPVIQHVVDRVDLENPKTLMSGVLLVSVLDKLGRWPEALTIIKQVETAHLEHRALGKDHPSTLQARYSHAHVLARLGRDAEAFPIIKEVIKAQESNITLGPIHPSTLASRVLLVEVLGGLGEFKKALPIIETLVRTEEASPAIGPNHPSTLQARALLAKVLDANGRPGEALAIIRDVFAKGKTSPALGIQHPSTNGFGFTLANVLNNLEKSQDALSVIEDVLAAQTANPAMGPDHPFTQASRDLLVRLRQKSTAGRRT